MFQKWIEPFQRETSGQSAMNHVHVITTMHRIQASPGYREAAHYCVRKLQDYGLQAELISYPADPNTYFGNLRSFREWNCHEGELLLVEPHHQRLARYTEMEMSIIQRSTSTPPEGVTTELVLVEDAEHDEGYEGLDVRGKLVLARGNVHAIVDRAVVKYGALGIVVDNMTEFLPVRTREDLIDAVQYTSFWWYDEPQTAFGFAVSPRVGDQLRRLYKKGPVTVFARVDAELHPGEMENVEAFIPGETDEEVLLVSHLCHPKPGANDNASGPSTLLETARVLNRLITEGKIAKPRRGIRFLLMPEFTGTHAHLHSRQERLKRTVAALNLDMVGADQTKGGGPLVIEKGGRALPTFTAELAHGIFEEVVSDFRNFSNTHSYSSVNYVLAPFSGGSDHFILSDPSVGIPCPMMITWPDKYYHTSMDTADHIDPKLMEKVATTAATYLYWIANAGLEELLALAGKMARSTSQEMELVLRAFLDGHVPFALAQEKLHFLNDRKQSDLHSLRPLVPQGMEDVWSTQLERHLQHVEQVCAYNVAELHALKDSAPVANAEPAVVEETDPLLQKVLVRKLAGPIDLRSFLHLLTPEELAQWERDVAACQEFKTLPVMIQYWLDGKRTLSEAIHLIELETGIRDMPGSLAYVKLLNRLDLLEEVASVGVNSSTDASTISR
jgi:aminopeptidase YwaD